MGKLTLKIPEPLTKSLDTYIATQEGLTSRDKSDVVLYAIQFYLHRMEGQPTPQSLKDAIVKKKEAANAKRKKKTVETWERAK